MFKNIFFRTVTAMTALLTTIGILLALSLPKLIDTINTNSMTSHKNITVIIDAGHGGEDGGAVGDDGTLEKDLNLDIALNLRDMLQANGTNVIMTRTQDIMLYDRNEDYNGKKKVLDLKARLEIANHNPDALFISIHMNAFPQKKYDGLQVYFPLGDTQSEALATIIQNNVKNTIQPQNLRRPKGAGSNIYLLNKSHNTSVLVECGFLSNDAECSKLNSPAYRQQLALILCNSIIEYISQDSNKKY